MGEGRGEAVAVTCGEEEGGGEAVAVGTVQRPAAKTAPRLQAALLALVAVSFVVLDMRSRKKKAAAAGEEQ